MEDLYDQIFQWKGEGDQIIIMGDLNEHILTKKIHLLLLPWNEGTNYLKTWQERISNYK